MNLKSLWRGGGQDAITIDRAFDCGSAFFSGPV